MDLKYMLQLLIAFKMTRSTKKIMVSKGYLEFEFSTILKGNPIILNIDD